ncbi:hypothetical protein P170DRAFT_263704 [Aspergillus steynii IBT 23096]|uniref:Uncharacterized protein n=1 Tax=Aspergillus steynii IBT 23096 TaxID=1392250 RepID=A0A2I2G0D5_9EURO|nr:uncharacterized protein P170DRAFT_263704 [Aspergillus steynii IBT 23096]PLB46296.1 hypothetical protein P170DRAFT_263704 [Aspergillus steynii IBT 23096]
MDGRPFEAYQTILFTSPASPPSESRQVSQPMHRKSQTNPLSDQFSSDKMRFSAIVALAAAAPTALGCTFVFELNHDTA